MEKFFLEGNNMAISTIPVDLNDGANAGARISLKPGQRCAFLIAVGDSTAATFTVSMEQHDAANSGNSKVLNISNSYFYKNDGATVFTKVTPASPAATVSLATPFAGNAGVAVFEVLASDLDVSGDFAWVSLNIADVTAAKLGAVIAVVGPCHLQPAYSDAL